MAITAALVKELRERTGAGMMDCKRALQETNGDIEVAIEVMRTKGQAKADKRASRVAAEGIIVGAVSEDGKRALMIEINSETDFVARDDSFVNFCNKVIQLGLSAGVKTLEELLALSVDGGDSIEDTRKALVAKIGENVNIRRLVASNTEGTLSTYVHGGRIGVMVELTGNDQDLGKDVAMHVAASSPLVVRPEDVDAALVEKEKEIFKAQALESGKPADIVEKMIVGRVKKYLNEVSLYGQAFIKDPNTSVEKLLKSKGADVVGFTRFAVGEGIEKKEDNFVEEVMAQAKMAGE